MKSFGQTNSVTDVLTGRGQDTQRHTGKNDMCGQRTQRWEQWAASQGMPGVAGNHQKLDEAREDSPLERLDRGWPC